MTVKLKKSKNENSKDKHKKIIYKKKTNKTDNKIEKKDKITKNNSKLKDELVNYLLELLVIVKVYHWKTKSYAVHKATDELYEILNENIDKFVEVMLGKGGTRLNMKNRKITMTDPSTKSDIKKIMYQYRILLENKMNQYITEENNTDLYNIRDEILGNINQFLYLITFE
jgi:DNA-binding ferritin-like protein